MDNRVEPAMTALQEAERLLPKLTRAEKALLAQRLVGDLGDAVPDRNPAGILWQ